MIKPQGKSQNPSPFKKTEVDYIVQTAYVVLMLYEIIIDQSLEISNSQFTSYQSRPFDSLRCKMMRYLSVWRPKMCSKYNCPANFSPPPEVFHLLRCRSTAFFSDQRLGKTCDDLERLHGMPWAFRPNHVRIIFWPDIKLHLHVHGSCCFRLFPWWTHRFSNGVFRWENISLVEFFYGRRQFFKSWLFYTLLSVSH